MIRRRQAGSAMSISRQRPISCEFCRSRKLRCSRETPCSNCTARGIKCSFLSTTSTRKGSQATVTASAFSTADQPTSETTRLPDNEILDRLKILEELVRNQSKGSNLDDDGICNDGIGRVVGPEARAQHVRPGSSMYRDVTDEVLLLERIRFKEGLKDLSQHETVIYQLYPIQQIRGSATFLLQNSGTGSRCICLPPYEEAKDLLQKYLLDVTSIHPITHGPTLLRMFVQCYEDLRNGSTVAPGQACLVLSVCLSATYFWTAEDSERFPFLPMVEAHRIAPLWLKAAEDVLNYLWSINEVSLESIQATIIASFVKCNLEGISVKARILFSTAITCARELGLHTLDQQKKNSSSGTIIDPVVAEISRRVWWYLSASEWMMSRYPGPSEGIVTVQLSQMVVNKPRHVNDDDLLDDNFDGSRPTNELTMMSYFLQRARLAEICRECSLRTNSTSSTQVNKYSDVMYFDAEFNAFYHKIPSFFDLSLEQSKDCAHVDFALVPWAGVQRYSLNSMFHTQLCKIHLRFFARGYVEPIYSYSRDVCIREARLIIRAEIIFERDNIPFAKSRMRFAGMLYGVFIASTIFLLDAYISKSTGKEVIWPTEAVDAQRILEESSHHTKVAADLFDTISRTMSKYGLRSTTEPHISSKHSNPMLTPPSITSETTMEMGRLMERGNAYVSPSAADFPDAEFLEQFGIDDWDTMFNGLEFPFM